MPTAKSSRKAHKDEIYVSPEVAQARQAATVHLCSWELLAMRAAAEGTSMAQVRLKYAKQLAGTTKGDEDRKENMLDILREEAKEKEMRMGWAV